MTSKNRRPDWVWVLSMKGARTGLTTAINHPFAGAMVARGFYQTDKRVVALMIEVRRDLYMDEGNVERLGGFGGVRRRIRSVISEIFDVIDID